MTKSRPGFRVSAQVVKGRLTFVDETDYRSKVNQLPDGAYDVVIEKYVPQRSNPQNAYLHAGPFPILMEEFGYTRIEDLKRDLMGECWGWAKSPVTGKDIPIRVHTSEMNVEECTHFIDWLITWAQMEHNVRLPLPDERQRCGDKPAA